MAVEKSFRQRVLKKALENLGTVAKGFKESGKALKNGRLGDYYSDRDMGNTADYFWTLNDMPFSLQLYCVRANDLLDVFDWQRTTGTDKMPIITGTGNGAKMLLKAGFVNEARRVFLEILDDETTNQRYRSRELCLLLAQAGLREQAKSVIPLARMIIDDSPPRGRKREAALLMDELFIGEMHFLLGEYGQCGERLADVLEAKCIIEAEELKLYSDTEKGADFEMAEGLKCVLDMLNSSADKEQLYKSAVAHLEKGLQYNYRLGEIEKQCYRCRLYTLMAKDILEGRAPNPNPFEGKCARESGRVPDWGAYLS